MAERESLSCFLILIVLVVGSEIHWVSSTSADETEYVSAVGDPGMRRDALRVGIESWNQCNEVGEEAPHMGSPRAADCFDIYRAIPNRDGQSHFSFSVSFASPSH